MKLALALLMVLATLSGALTACAPTSAADSNSTKRQPPTAFGFRSDSGGGGGGY